MGVSAGTFIYIATAEIIVEEFSITDDKFKKFFGFLLGIGVMALVWVVEEKENAG